MRRIKLLSVALLAVAVAFGCKPQEKDDAAAPKTGLQTAVFSAALTGTTETSATFHIDVKENDQATWYCVLTQDLTSKPADAFAAAMKGINVTRHILEGSHAKDTTFTGLRQGWPYRLIVSGLIANGTAYGEPATVDFNCAGDIIWSKDDLAENKDIVISSEVSEEGVAAISVTGAPAKYTIDLVEASVLSGEEFGGDVAAYIISAAAAAREAGNFSQYIYEGDKTISEKLDENVKYAIVVYGVNDNFNVTKDYATATVTYATFVPKYEDYAGYWDIKVGEEAVANWLLTPVTLEQQGPAFQITGTNLADFKVIGLWDDEAHAFYIPSQQLGSNDTYTFLFYGFDQDEYAESASQNPHNSALAYFTLQEDGTINAVGEEYEAVYSGTTYPEQIVAIGVIGVTSDNKMSTFDGLDAIALPAILVEGEAPAEPSEDPSVDPGDTGYAAWLGAWDVTRGTTKDRWTIAADVEGTSYTITGIDGMNVAIPATYDAESGALKLASQASSQNEVNPYIVQLVNGLAGMIEVSGKRAPVGGSYAIATATLTDENTATLASAGALKITGFDDPLPIVGMCIYGVPAGAESGYVYVNDFTTFPETMTRASEGGSETPSDPYAAWIGSYTADLSGNKMAFAITEKVKGESLTLVYPKDMYEYEVELTYNAADNTVAIANGQVVDEYENQSYGPVIDYLYGAALKGEDSQPINGTYAITTGTMSNDGSQFVLGEGPELTLSDNSTAQIEVMSVFGIIQEGQYAGYFIDYFSGGTGSDGTVYPELRFFLPVTFTKDAAATSSAKAPANKAFRPYRFMENRVKTAERVLSTSGKKAVRSYKAQGFVAADDQALVPVAKVFAR